MRHRLELEGGVPNHVVVYEGRERLGQVYRFQVHFLLENSVEIELSELVGQRATLTTESEDFDPFVNHGVVAAVELVEVFDQFSLYRIEIVPEVWRAALSRHTRVFVDVNVKELLAAMFRFLGLSAEQVRLAFSANGHRSYPQICQFEESDLDFMTRWMEKEGLHYYFEQKGSEECLVVVDGPPASQELADSPVAFSTAADRKHSSITRFRPRSQLQTRELEVRGYDSANPATPAEATLDLGGKRAGLGVSVALSNEIPEPKVDREVRLLQQIELARRLVFAGEANVPFFRSGYHFRGEGHLLPRMDGEYYVTEVQHHAVQPCDDCPAALEVLELQVQDAFYTCKFECVRGDVVFRVPRTTAVPRVYGTLSGVVDGADETSDYAQLDDQGRYKVRLRFDEEHKVDGARSMWVRMVQNHAGNPEGLHFPLRKGTEVMLVFLGGDPDQPLIVGAVPNALTRSPVIQTNQTQNVLHTSGGNRFELEDLLDQQHIDLKTPSEETELYMGAARVEGSLSYNLIEKTTGDGFLQTGRNYDVTIGGTHTERITGAVRQTYESKRTTSVADDVVELFNKNQRTKILEDVNWEVVGDYQGHAHGDYTLKVDGDYKVDYDADNVTTVHGNSSTTLMGATNENFLGAVNSNHAAAVNSNFGGLVANTFVAGYANLNLAAGVDINAGVPLAVNVAGSLTCDLALAGSLFVGGTLDLRLAVDITIALCSLSVTGLAACENVIYLNNNMIDCSGKLFDLKQAIIDYRKADTTVEG
ncbi:MAG: type VI secretion system tip protein VgrG [Myxococcales bacterium]|nr:type VI secretion system tip protein VgrG [Myxococcales bacterium]